MGPDYALCNEVSRAERLEESGTLRKTRWGYSRAIVSNEGPLARERKYGCLKGNH